MACIPAVALDCYARVIAARMGAGMLGALGSHTTDRMTPQLHTNPFPANTGTAKCRNVPRELWRGPIAVCGASSTRLQVYLAVTTSRMEDRVPLKRESSI